MSSDAPSGVFGKTTIEFINVDSTAARDHSCELNGFNTVDTELLAVVIADKGLLLII
jgi:hypothetical protein